MRSGSATKRAVIAVSIVTTLLVVIAVSYGSKPDGSITLTESIDTKVGSCEPDNGAIARTVVTQKSVETKQLPTKEVSEQTACSPNDPELDTVVVEPLAPTVDIPINEINNKTENSVKYSYVAKPSIDWDADEAVYRAIVEEDERQGKLHIGHSDPQLKLSMKFAQWRGRNSGQLGGFELSPSSIKVLAGWKVTSRDISVISLIGIQQTVKLSKGKGKLLVSTGLFLSAGWAHQGLVNKKKFSTNPFAGVASEHNWGDLCGVDIGDVWFSGPDPQRSDIYGEGRFHFIRRNVSVQVWFDSGEGSSVPLDLMAFARELDLQIIDQGLSGYEWADIADACPKIAQFEAESNTLPAKTGASTSILFSVDSVQNGDKISLQTANYGLAKIYILGKNPSATLGYVGPENEDQILPTAKVWLVAINERNLLFSVAEIEFTLVKPD